jgi:hypothetical protein
VAIRDSAKKRREGQRERHQRHYQDPERQAEPERSPAAAMQALRGLELREPDFVAEQSLGIACELPDEIVQTLFGIDENTLSHEASPLVPTMSARKERAVTEPSLIA